MKSVSTARTWAFYEHLSRHFDEVVVITTSNRQRLIKENVDVSHAEVHEVETYDYRRFLSTRVKKGSPSLISEVRKSSKVARLAGKLKASFPTNYVFGEGGWHYINNAVRKAQELIDSRGFQYVLSSYPPYADHVIAYRIKQMNPEMHWIADFRDLHLDPTLNNVFMVDYQRKVNTRILSFAETVLTVSKGLATHLELLHNNVYVLRNGMRRKTLGPSTQSSTFDITYTGSMFRDKRRADLMLEVIKQMLQDGQLDERDVRVIYAGKDEQVWKQSIAHYGLEHVFESHGLKSKAEADALQVSSNINLLLTYSSKELKGNLTGKLYDYLAARRPIIAIVNGPVDEELEDVITSVNAGIVAYHGTGEGKQAMIEMISKLYHSWKEGTDSWEFNEDALEPFYWDCSIDRLIEYLGKNE